MKLSSQRSSVDLRRQPAFTLLEVMIAMFVFFIVVFAILGVVVQSLSAARALQRPQVDASLLAGQLSLTNCLDEGYDTGDFEDLFPNHRWERAITAVGTNNLLWQVDFAVFEKTKAGKENVETMSVLMAKPSCSGVGVRR